MSKMLTLFHLCDCQRLPTLNVLVLFVQHQDLLLAFILVGVTLLRPWVQVLVAVQMIQLFFRH